MIEKFLKTFIIILGILTLINLVVLDFFWVKNKPSATPAIRENPTEEATAQPTFISSTPVPPTPTPLSSSTNTSCPQSCQTIIDEKIAQVSGKETTTAVVYYSLGGSFTINNLDWADVSGSDFYFDLANYPGAKGVRFETSLRVFLASNPAYIRLYDVTNKRAVDFSELSTTKNTFEFLQSVDLAIWQGNNLYRLQMKSPSGTEAYLNSPRLKISF